MEMLLGLIGLVILVVVYLRRFLLRKDVEPAQRVPFRGELYPVGGATLSRQRSGNPKQSVVVVHGFVENFREVPPCRAMPCEIYRADRPLRFVIEVPAGTAERLGLNEGDQLQIGTRLSTPLPLL